MRRGIQAVRTMLAVAAMGALIMLVAGPAMCGDKAAVAVGEITSKTGRCSADQAAAIGDLLAEALTGTGDFIVVEEGDLTGLEGVIVRATVEEFKPEVTGGGGLGGLKKRALSKVGVEETTAELEIEMELIDAVDGKRIKKKTIKAESADWDVDVTSGTWADGLELEETLDEFAGGPMEAALFSAIEEAVDLIDDEVPEAYYKYEGDEDFAGASAGGPGAEGAGDEGAGKPAGGITSEDMTLYTKYDFIPGSKVIFYDDMEGEEEGEFPYRWNLERGVFEVVRLGKEFWIMCTDEGGVRPKIEDAPLPPKYTVELEIHDGGPDKRGHYFYIYWMDADGRRIGEFSIKSSQLTYLAILGEQKASKRLTTDLSRGVHTMRIMATTRSIKCYIDNVRVANVPQIEGFNPVGFTVWTDPWSEEDNPMLFRGFRFAEGGKSMREQLEEEGKIITHGILFDIDSYKIKGESYKTLKEIGDLLVDDPDLRLSIEGHTDSDGSDEHNMTLSQNRAGSVRDYLVSTYGIDPARLEAKGWGESKAIDTNETAEGKANNRRVELIPL